MEYLEALESLKKPNDPYNLDMMALRTVILELVKRSETEVLVNEPKKGKKK